MNLSALRAELRDVVRKMSVGGDSGHDLAHADRVWAHARTIAHGEGVDVTPVLLCAAYLHDLVSLPKDLPMRNRAAMMSASAAGPDKPAHPHPPPPHPHPPPPPPPPTNPPPPPPPTPHPNHHARARHAIEAHSYSGGTPPGSTEAKILRDADRLEALGAIGVARCFAVSGALDRPLIHPDDPFARDRAPDDQSYALDHFAVKLLKLPETFLTATGRKLAEDRAEKMRRYLVDLAGELGFPPPDW